MFSLSDKLVTVAALLLAITGSAQSPKTQSAGQSSPAATQSAPAAATQAVPSDVTIKAKTQVVLLDVIATDKKGNPITDLKREDFTVLEKGKPQQLASFNIVDTAKRSAMPAAGGLKMPPGVYTNRKAEAAQEGQLTVLLLDALNTPWSDQAYARQEMIKYLKKNIQPGQRMAIYGLNTTLVRMQDFTDDPALLLRVLNKDRGGTSPMLDDPNATGTSTEGMSAEMAAAVASFEEQEAAMRMDMRVRMTLDALKAIGRQLSGYQGRKKLIWVSASFPVQLDPGDNAGFSSQRLYADDIEATTSLLRDSQVAVYTVDAQGLTGSPVASAQFTGRGRNGRLMNGPQMSGEIQRRQNLVTSAQQAAREIADGTGGLAFYNRNDLDTAVMKSVADGAVYYSLSYSPDDKNWNGQYRKIEVKVNRPGLELRYRKGYYAREAQSSVNQASGAVLKQDIDQAMMSLLTATGITFYGSALPAQGGAGASALDPAAKKPIEVRFLVEPRDILFEHTSDNRQHCNLQFVVATFIAEKLANAVDRHLECNLEPATYARILRDGILFRVPLDAPAGQARLRLMVRDNLAGKMGSLDVPYQPGATQAAKPQ